MSMILSLSVVSLRLKADTRQLTWRRVVLQQPQQLDLHPRVRNLVVDVFWGQVAVEHNLLSQLSSIIAIMVHLRGPSAVRPSGNTP